MHAEQYRLVLNFGYDGLLPELFFEWFGGFDLCGEDAALEGIAIEIEQEAGGVVGVIAGDEGGVVGEQFGYYGLGDGDLLVIEYEHAYVFDRYGGGLGLYNIGGVFGHGELYYQLIEVGAEVGGVAEVEGALDHKIF